MNIESQKMPLMRILSVGVTPSFFFLAKWYSITISAMPMPKAIAIHFKIVFTVGLRGWKRPVYRKTFRPPL